MSFYFLCLYNEVKSGLPLPFPALPGLEAKGETRA